MQQGRARLGTDPLLSLLTGRARRAKVPKPGESLLAKAWPLNVLRGKDADSGDVD
jgi:hypothetical protein